MVADPNQPATTPAPQAATPVANQAPQATAASTTPIPSPRFQINFSQIKNKLLVVLIAFLALSALLAIEFGAAAAIAYGKISINNPALEKEISTIVFSLPFTPKPPNYLLTQAVLAQKKVSKHSVDLSVAVDTGSPIPTLGISNIDLKLTGAVDYSDTKNPRLSLNLAVTKDFNADLRKNDHILYFKINKLPMVLLGPMLGIKDFSKVDTIIKNWVAYDTTPVQSEARKALDNSDQRTTSYTNEAIEKSVNTLLDKEVLKAITTKEEKLDQLETYKLTLQPTPEILDRIADNLNKESTATTSAMKSAYQPPKPSETIKDVDINLWIDKKDYYVRKLSVVFKINSSATGSYSPLGTLGSLSTAILSKPSDVSIASVLTLSDFGKTVNVETPSQSITPEAYTQMFMQSSDIYNQQVTGAKDTMRKQQLNAIRAALEGYYADNSKYPNTLSALAPKYLQTVPVDPETNRPFSYSLARDGKSYTLQATLSSGQAYTVTSPK